jgi:hypothetical protein
MGYNHSILLDLTHVTIGIFPMKKIIDYIVVIGSIFFIAQGILQIHYINETVPKDIDTLVEISDKKIENEDLKLTHTIAIKGIVNSSKLKEVSIYLTIISLFLVSYALISISTHPKKEKVDIPSL